MSKRDRKDDPKESDEIDTADLPLSETIEPLPPMHPEGDVTRDFSYVGPTDRFDSSVIVPAQPVQLGETLQLVRFSRRDKTLMITGLTPHGRRLTFEQREDRDGWYVVAGGRRRRPTERELLLVVASITQEMEAATAPEGESEVRSAYRLAASSDQPGIPVRGLQAYRDLLLDEAAAYTYGQIDSLAVVAIEYQAFKRFAIRHGHRVAAAFVRALGEQLADLFEEEKKLHCFHKAGKSYRLVMIDRSAREIQELIARVTSDESRRWIVERVWGKEGRTHPNEVHFYIGIAKARPSERESDYESLAQRLNDDAYRAAKLGQLKGHTSIHEAKSDYRTTVYNWVRSSRDDLAQLASEMDDGPAEVMAELEDYLHELSPADLEGMAVEGDVAALIHKAIARENFWQGTTAMRIVGERLLSRFISREEAPEGERNHVGGFAFGDEFYGVAIEDNRFYLAWGDINSAGATRLRAGLEKIQRAVGWRREDGGGIVGEFVRRLAPDDSSIPLPVRIRNAAQACYDELSADESLRVNDAVDISDFLETRDGEPILNEDIVEGAQFILTLPRRRRLVSVIERRSSFIARLEIEGQEYPVAINDTPTGPQVKLRVKNTIVSSAICILHTRYEELVDMLAIVREDNNMDEDTPIDIIGFLRHVADILLLEQVKAPSKIELALGARYSAEDFIQDFSLEEVREEHPGLFYEAVHHNLLAEQQPLHLDRNLRELIESTMLAKVRPDV